MAKKKVDSPFEVSKETYKELKEAGKELVKAGANAEEAGKELNKLAGNTNKATEGLKKVGKSGKKAKEGLQQTEESTKKAGKQAEEAAKEFKILGDELDRIFNNEYNVKINESDLQNLLRKMGMIQSVVEKTTSAVEKFQNVFNEFIDNKKTGVDASPFVKLLNRVNNISTTLLMARASFKAGQNGQNDQIGLRTTLKDFEDVEGKYYNAAEIFKDMQKSLDNMSKAKLPVDKIESLVDSLYQIKKLLDEIRIGLNLGSMVSSSFIEETIQKNEKQIKKLKRQTGFRERQAMKRSFEDSRGELGKIATMVMQDDENLQSEDILKLEKAILKFMDLGGSLEETKIKLSNGTRNILQLVRKLRSDFKDELATSGGLNQYLEDYFDVEKISTKDGKIKTKIVGVKNYVGAVGELVELEKEQRKLEKDLALAKDREANKPSFDLNDTSVTKFAEAIKTAATNTKNAVTGVSAEFQPEQFEKLLEILQKIEQAILTINTSLTGLDFNKIQTAEDEQEEIISLSEVIEEKNQKLQGYLTSLNVLSDSILENLTKIHAQFEGIDFKSLVNFDIKEGSAEEIKAASEAIKQIVSSLRFQKIDDEKDKLEELAQAYAKFISLGGKEDISSFTNRKKMISSVLENYSKYLDSEKPKVDLSDNFVVTPQLKENAKQELQEALNKLDDLTVPVELDPQNDKLKENISNASDKIADLKDFIKNIQNVINEQSDELYIKIHPELSNFIKELQDFLNNQKVELKVSPKAAKQISQNNQPKDNSYNEIVKYYQKVASLKRGLLSQGQEEAAISKAIIKNLNERIRYRLSKSQDTFSKSQIQTIKDLQIELQRADARNRDIRTKNALDFSANYSEAISKNITALQDEANQANNLMNKINQYEDSMVKLGQTSDELNNILENYRNRIKNATNKTEINSISNDFTNYQKTKKAEINKINSSQEEANQVNRLIRRIDTYENSIKSADQATDDFTTTLEEFRNRLKNINSKFDLKTISDDFNSYKKDYANQIRLANQAAKNNQPKDNSFNEIVKYYQKINTLKRGLLSQGQEEAAISKAIIKNLNERIRYRLSRSQDTFDKSQMQIIKDWQTEIKRANARNQDIRTKNALDFSADYDKAMSQNINNLHEEANQANRLMKKINQYEDSINKFGNTSEEVNNVLNKFRERIKNASGKSDLLSITNDFTNYQKEQSVKTNQLNALQEEANQAYRLMKKVDQYETDMIKLSGTSDELNGELNKFRERIKNASSKFELKSIADDFSIYQKNKQSETNQFNSLYEEANQINRLIKKMDDYENSIKAADRVTDEFSATLTDFRNKLKNASGKFDINTVSDNFNSYKKDYANRIRLANQVQKQIDYGQNIKEQGYTNFYGGLNAYNSFVEKFDEISNLNGKKLFEFDSEGLNKLLDDFNELYETVEKLGNTTKLKKTLLDISTFMSENDKIAGSLKEQFDNLTASINEMLKTGEYTPEQVKQISAAFITLKKEANETGQVGKKFATTFKEHLTSLNAHFFAVYFSMQDWIRYIRQAISVVTDLDTALTQLKIVSGAADAELSQVAKSAYRMANNLGSTTTDIVNSITEWRRLGKTIEESEILAEQAAKLSTGGIMDVNTATTALISSMQAFEMGAEDVSKVVDQYIYLGK